MSVRYSIAMIVVSTVLLAGAGVAWTSISNARQDQRWCEWFEAQLLPDVPPTTDRGRAIEQSNRHLYEQYHCDDRKKP